MTIGLEHLAENMIATLSRPKNRQSLGLIALPKTGPGNGLFTKVFTFKRGKVLGGGRRFCKKILVLIFQGGNLVALVN